MFPDLDDGGLRHSALLLLDLQRVLCLPDGPLGATPLSQQVEERRILPKVAAVTQRWRQAGRQVIHVRVDINARAPMTTNRTERFQAFASRGLFDPDAEHAAFVSEAAPVPGEVVITKSGVNPFIGTPLTELLLGAGVRTVFLAGVATNFVVESAARHASDVGLNVWVLADLCASHDADLHNFSVERMLPSFARVTTASESRLL